MYISCRENVIMCLFSPTSNPHIDIKDNLHNGFTTIFIKYISAKGIFLKKYMNKVADFIQEIAGKKKIKNPSVYERRPNFSKL